MCRVQDRAPSISKGYAVLPKLSLEAERECAAKKRVLFQEIKWNWWKRVAHFPPSNNLYVLVLKLDQVRDERIISFGPS